MQTWGGNSEDDEMFALEDGDPDSDTSESDAEVPAVADEAPLPDGPDDASSTDGSASESE